MYLNTFMFIITNTLVSNHFHSVKNFYFRLPNHVILMECQALDFRCQCTQRKLESISGDFFYIFGKRQISIKLFYLYQRRQCTDNYFFKIKLVYVFIYCCRHHERKTTCLDIFSLSDIDSVVPNPSIYSAVFFASPYYNYL